MRPRVGSKASRPSLREGEEGRSKGHRAAPQAASLRRRSFRLTLRGTPCHGHLWIRSKIASRVSAGICRFTWLESLTAAVVA